MLRDRVKARTEEAPLGYFTRATVPAAFVAGVMMMAAVGGGGSGAASARRMAAAGRLTRPATKGTTGPGPIARVSMRTAAARQTGDPAPQDTPTRPGSGYPAAQAAQGHPGRLELKSNSALVLDEAQGLTLYSKNSEQVVPIASITKLMTAMVVLDAQLPFEPEIVIDREDGNGAKHTPSRLHAGMRLSRGDLLWVALMASENRAAAALARTYPGGTGACVAAMNQKALDLGMLNTRFADATGLSSENVSSAQELSRMVRAAYAYPPIRRFTTSTSHEVTLPDGRILEFHNSNGLVKNPTWTIGLSKTGYINEAGRCLVMQAHIAARPVIIVLLDSWGKYTRLGDANRIRKWMETTLPRRSATG